MKKYNKKGKIITVIIYVIDVVFGLPVLLSFLFAINPPGKYNELIGLPSTLGKTYFYSEMMTFIGFVGAFIWGILYLILRGIRLSSGIALIESAVEVEINTDNPNQIQGKSKQIPRSKKQNVIIRNYELFLKRTLNGQIFTVILNLFKITYALIIILALSLSGIKNGEWGVAIGIIFSIGIIYWFFNLILKSYKGIAGFKNGKTIQENLDDLRKKTKVNNKKKKNSSKEVAFEELKRLKELFDLELLTQQEFEAKSKELKEIILESKDATD